MSIDSISRNTGHVKQNARTSQIRERLDRSQPDGLERVCSLRNVCVRFELSLGQSVSTQKPYPQFHILSNPQGLRERI